MYIGLVVYKYVPVLIQVRINTYPCPSADNWKIVENDKNVLKLWNNPGSIMINEEQREALKRSMQAPFTMIQGPPGSLLSDLHTCIHTYVHTVPINNLRIMLL